MIVWPYFCLATSLLQFLQYQCVHSNQCLRLGRGQNRKFMAP